MGLALCWSGVEGCDTTRTLVHLECFTVWTEPRIFAVGLSCEVGRANYLHSYWEDGQPEPGRTDVREQRAEGLSHFPKATQRVSGLSLDSSPDEVMPDSGLPHPTPLPLGRTARQMLPHPHLRAVSLPTRALSCVSTEHECLSEAGQGLRHAHVDKQHMQWPACCRPSLLLSPPKQALSWGC